MSFLRRSSSVSALGSGAGSGSRLVLLTTLGVANLFSATVISIMAPFYPNEAALKGASPTQHGFVFAIFHLTMFFAAPAYGTLLAKMSPSKMFWKSIFVTGSSAVLFGFLAYIDDLTTFLVLSFALRSLQALGHSANIASSFTLITKEFPQTFATTFATLETCFGLGLIVGPFVGGVLYEFGGFPLPFFAMGSLLICTSVVSSFLVNSSAESEFEGVLTEKKPMDENSPKSEVGTFGFLSLLKVPACLLAGTSIAVSSCSVGFLQATLEPFLRENFNLSPMYTGFVFVIDGLMYALTAPLWGRLCDKWLTNPKFVTLAGCTLTFTGFLLVGPAPGVGAFIPTSLWITCLALGIHGLGMGASFVSAFIQGIQDSIAAGFPNSVSTYGLVSGLWISGLALGNFVGPSAGGLLLDHFSFSQSCVFVLLTQILMAISTVIFICIQKRRGTNQESPEDIFGLNAPLLSSRSQGPGPGTSSQSSL